MVRLDRRPAIIFLCLIPFLGAQVSYAAPIMYRVQQKKMMEQRERQMQVQAMIAVHYHPQVVVQEQEVAPTYEQAVDHRNQAIAQAIRNAHNQSGSNEDQQLISNSVQQTSSPIILQKIVSALKYVFGLIKNFIDGIIGFIFNKAPVDQAQQQTFSSGEDGQSSPVERINQDQQESFKSTVAPQVSTVAPRGSTVTAEASGEGEDVVDLSEVWKKLDKKSTVWKLLDDDQSKLLTVSEFIGRYQKEGVKINQPAAHYVELIDQMLQQNPQMLERPFGELLQILAIIDYDFDNGMDKDSLAKQVLGEAGYQENKKRISQQQEQQQQQQQRPQQQQAP